MLRLYAWLLKLYPPGFRRAHGREMQQFVRTLAASPRRNFIDDHVLRKLRELRLPPSAQCSDAEFIRRAYLDAAGILPTAEELSKFLADRSAEYFASGYPSPVMLLVFDVLEHQRERVPAITHADGTARVQTVSAADNPLYHRLISRFDEITGVPMVVNTSFNDNEEPIVCTPAEAVNCYLRTEMDALALGPFWTQK